MARVEALTISQRTRRERSVFSLLRGRRGSTIGLATVLVFVGAMFGGIDPANLMHNLDRAHSSAYVTIADRQGSTMIDNIQLIGSGEKVIFLSPYSSPAS